MAKYKATQNFQCWKQHRCFGCSALYRYLFQRQATATSNTPEKAQNLVRRNLETLVNTTVDQNPCPQCGCYQPDMSGQHRRGRYKRFGWVFWSVLALVAILTAADAVTVSGLTLTVTIVVGLCAAVQAWTAFHDRNRHLEQNRRAAGKAMAKDTLRLDAPGAGNQPQPGAVLGGPGSPVYVLLLLGVLALPVAEVFRAIQHWPVNEKFYPQVVGAGDKVTYYMPHSITSVKSYWRGKPSVAVTNFLELGLAGGEWEATAKDNSWSGTISVKSSEKNESSKPWISFRVPVEKALEGKVAQLKLKLQTEFPQMVGTDKYHTVREDFEAASDLTLAPPGAGTQYETLWYGGLVASTLLLAVAVWMLCRHARNSSQNTQTGLIPLERPASVMTPPPLPPSLPGAR